MKIICEFDDIHPNEEVDCLDIAEQLLSANPSLTLNFFIPPNYRGDPVFNHKDWCIRLRTLVDSGRVCLGIHGYNHNMEFKSISYQDAVTKILASEATLNTVGLSYVKVFRGPFWAICEATCEALCDLGYTHLYSHNDYFELNEKFKGKIKIPIYNWNLKDDHPKLESPLVTDICIAHGHTSKYSHLSCGNSIWDVFPKIEKLIEEHNPAFLRLDEY